MLSSKKKMQVCTCDFDEVLDRLIDLSFFFIYCKQYNLGS